MANSRLGKQLSIELYNIDMLQVDLAKKTGLSKATITQVISSRLRERRISPDSLKAICHAFNHDTNIRLLIKHLQDEIERADYDGNSTLNISEIKKHDDSKRNKILAEITSRALYDDNLYSILYELHQLIKI